MEGYQLTPLLSRKQIDSIIKDLADQISKAYVKRDLIVICILKGAFMFLSDIIRHLKIPVQIDFVRLSSYAAGMETSRQIQLTKDIEIAIEDRDVLIIEDIVDSGHTLRFLKDRLTLSKPRSIKICALLDKKARREIEIEVDYVGKEIENVFVVGYGIDFNETYRQLPEIYYLTPIDQSKD